jgi:acetyltransferase-like isoleucine patch superfamily enzyme
MLNFIKTALDDWIFRKFEAFSKHRHLVYGDKTKLFLPQVFNVNNALFNVVGGTITLQERVFFGHNVLVLAGTHDYQKLDSERMNGGIQGNDILIEEGVWVASGAIIIGPAIIGRYAVVAAGAVVRGDVPAYTLVAGVPAKVVKHIGR